MKAKIHHIETTGHEDIPRRRVSLNIEIEADDWDSVAFALNSIRQRAMQGPIDQMTSGGYDHGYTAVGMENPEQTGDLYRLQLAAWAKSDA